MKYHFFGTQRESANVTRAFEYLQIHKQLGNFSLGLKMTLDMQRPLLLEVGTTVRVTDCNVSKEDKLAVCIRICPIYLGMFVSKIEIL